MRVETNQVTKSNHLLEVGWIAPCHLESFCIPTQLRRAHLHSTDCHQKFSSKEILQTTIAVGRVSVDESESLQAIELTSK